MKKVLSIAGSDCSGGAGIQADLKTFSAHGVFGMSVIVSVVAENTSRVIDIQDITPDMIEKQIDAVFEDIEVDVVKIGIADTLELIGLSNAGKKRVANFSLGMKQRLALGVALLGEPEFLILDEPVNGLDPTGIIELRGLLKKLVKERETTILISSHILSELHQLATCYGFLHKGELLKQISAQKLNEECKRHICLKTDNIQKTTLILEQKANIKNYSVYPDNSIRIYDCLDNVRMISKLLTDNEIIIDEISVQGEDLETYFENLIGGRKNV